MKVLLSMLVAVMFLSACGEQDPLAGLSPELRAGQPPVEKPQAPRPLAKEALQIDSPNRVNGYVGSTLNFKITGRVMIPGVQFAVSVDNLEDFPGATFDPVTGDLQWTPVREKMSGPVNVFPMMVSLVTIATDAFPAISKEVKQIEIVVENTYTKPIINTITGNTAMAVGSNYELEFSMEDRDALNAKDVAFNVVDCPYDYTEVRSVAHLVTVMSVNPVSGSPSKFTGRLRIALKDATNFATGRYCFALRAVSKYNQSSDLFKKDLAIEAKLQNTKITMDTAELFVGEKSRVAFSIYDPTSTGSLSFSMTDIATELPGSFLTCVRPPLAVHKIDCQGLIDATQLEPKPYFISFSVDNRSNTTGRIVNTKHTYRVIVKAAP